MSVHLLITFGPRLMTLTTREAWKGGGRRRQSPPALPVALSLLALGVSGAMYAGDTSSNR
jgi:hypothetical protein